MAQNPGGRPLAKFFKLWRSRPSAATENPQPPPLPAQRPRSWRRPELGEIEAAARALRALKGGSLQFARLASAIERVLPLLEGVPRLVLLGEFNTGKSALANVLARLGHRAARKTAQDLAPSLAEPADGVAVPAAVLIHAAGKALAVGRGLADHRVYLQVPSRAPLLADLQILDLPGLSDPTRDADALHPIAREAQIAVWCTSATQAWKASDLEAWGALPRRLREASILAVTRMDALESPEDGARVLRRLQREAGGLFRYICPVSAKIAAGALDGNGEIAHPEAWEKSGLPVLEERLAGLAREQKRLLEQRASALLARRAALALEHGEVFPGPGTVDPMIEDWRRVIGSLAAPVAAGEKPLDAAVDEFIALAQRVASEVLRPWLQQHFDPPPGTAPRGDTIFHPLRSGASTASPEPMVFPPLRFASSTSEPMVFPPVPPEAPLPSASVLSLADFDRPRLMALLAGRPAAEAAELLAAIGHQAASEIGELVAALPPRPTPGAVGLDEPTRRVIERIRDGSWWTEDG